MAALTTVAAGDSTPIIQVLREQLQSKDRQLQTLETQLDRKDDQIKSLNERMHESNVLMGELQRRLAIAAPVANKGDPINAESTSDSVHETVSDSKPRTTAKPTPKSQQQPGSEIPAAPKRRSLFGNLFRRQS